MMNAYEELYHYGILGMKWGVRRFQKKNGDLTRAGKKRYSKDNETKEQNDKPIKEPKTVLQSAGKKSISHVDSNEKKTYDSIAKDIYTLAPQSKEEKTKGFKKALQNHKDSLYKKYREEGYSDKAAKKLVEDRVKKERLAAIACGALAIGITTAVVVKSVKKKSDSNQSIYTSVKNQVHSPLNNGKAFVEDALLDLGATPMHRIAGSASLAKGRAFYAAFEDFDKKQYRVLYAGALRQKGEHPYDITIKTNGSVKLAGRNTAKKAFIDLVSTDPDFAMKVFERNKLFSDNLFIAMHEPKLHNACNTADSILMDIIRRDVNRIKSYTEQQYDMLYDAFNVGLVQHDGRDIQDKYYSKLRSMGYHAIEDINDQKYSGYNTKHPLIVFDDSIIAGSSAERLR